MKSIEFITENSADAILEEYLYSKGALTLIINLTEIDVKVKVSISTEHLSFNSFYTDNTDSLYRTCIIEVKELSNFISTNNGVYIPSDRFGDLMKESKARYNLAYGKRASELKYIFSLVGYGNILSCLLSDLNCIVMMEI